MTVGGVVPGAESREPRSLLAGAPADLLARTFRASPDYELVPHDALPAPQRSALGAREGVHGVLRPRVPGLALKALDARAAALLASLSAPAPIALDACDDADALAREIAALVLDHVLEVEQGGAFVRGAAAHATLLACREDAEPVDRIAHLSRDALRIAAALPVADARELSRRLYRFNAAPVTARWRRRLPSSDAIESWLGVDDAAGTPAAWRRDGWERVASGGVWASWRRSHDDGLASELPRHKVYASVRADALPDALHALVAALGATHATDVKVGRTLGSVLRPDKLVAYFHTADALDDAVPALRDAMRRFSGAAQGTPFTRALDERGALSRGFDPTAGALGARWRGSESWRLWVTNRLATYLLAARATPGAPVAPWRFAIDRIALDGVDPASWAPRFAAHDRAR